MASRTNSGIKTTGDGSSVIPASKRADGSVRKEIRVKPGYTPPEDVETYKSRNAEAWKNRGTGGVPGADSSSITAENKDGKSKNAKRREAARRRAETDGEDEHKLAMAMDSTSLEDGQQPNRNLVDTTSARSSVLEGSHEADIQKKVRNLLKKLKAVQDLRSKATAGDKLSPEQFVKLSTEADIVRDLKKLDYNGPGISGNANPGTNNSGSILTTHDGS